MVDHHDQEIEDTRPDNYDDENVVQRAISDTQDEPSIWWIDFLEQDFAGKDSVQLEKQLADSMRLVKEYRNWESLRAWRYVFSNDKVPQDSSAMSTAERTSLFAETSVTDAKFDSWLALCNEHPRTREISCEASDFYTQLVHAALEGFLGVNEKIVERFQGIFDSLCQSVAADNSSHPRKKLLVLQRYLYSPGAMFLRSYVRYIEFTITDEMKAIQNAVLNGDPVGCTIQYNERDTTFDLHEWAGVEVPDEEKATTDEFRQMQTV